VQEEERGDEQPRDKVVLGGQVRPEALSGRHDRYTRRDYHESQ